MIEQCCKNLSVWCYWVCFFVLSPTGIELENKKFHQTITFNRKHFNGVIWFDEIDHQFGCNGKSSLKLKLVASMYSVHTQQLCFATESGIREYSTSVNVVSQTFIYYLFILYLKLTRKRDLIVCTIKNSYAAKYS